MRCLYVAADGHLGLVDDPRLAATTERHKLDLLAAPYGSEGAPLDAIDRDAQLAGVILEMSVGWLRRGHLSLLGQVLARDRRAWVYWPGEQAVECVHRERLASLWRHWFLIAGYFNIRRATGGVRRYLAKERGIIRKGLRVIRTARRVIRRGLIIVREVPPGALLPRVWRRLLSIARASRTRSQASKSIDNLIAELHLLIDRAAPARFEHPAWTPSADRRIPGCGVYLRTDFWLKIESGGSYGHTCYVAKELAAVTERFVCFMAQRYRMLDDYGLRQIVLVPPSASASEDDIVAATDHYVKILGPAVEALRPAFIYERLCLGNYAGALLSLTLGIPYIVEYNGSEISMRRSFDGGRYIYEDEFLEIERFAFRQATMISVVSAEVKRTLIARGVPSDKILVNPNGADLTAYAPAVDGQKAAIRSELGISDAAAVIGFTGTFGGWHGIDVLAAAIPRICERTSEATFLLIGDGNYRHLVDRQVAAHHLHERVRTVGRVPQAEGARLLKACDIYVAPHNSHMVDSRFFGSPTKIFEYMAMAGATVASDLEQIGDSLSPALRATDLVDPDLVVTDERAVLCSPGDVDEFVDAVVRLVRRPDLWPKIGANARTAVERHYSWSKHVARLWPFLAGERERAVPSRSAQPQSSAPRAPALLTGDAYKDEAQRQWDNDPAGSQYVKHAEPHTLQWFLEVESYRYREYAPWMPETMEFAGHRRERLLEIGGGIGTDLSQFAANGAVVTDIDLSAGHLELARENFRLRGLEGTFVHHDAESLPFEADTFDVVYSNGVLHHTPHTRHAVEEIFRVLKPSGVAIVMVYAENSLHYWRSLVWGIGLRHGELERWSMGEIMSRSVERSDNAAARPLVKVYTQRRLRNLFAMFTDIKIVQRQLMPAEVPRPLSAVPVATLGRIMGWNLIIKARKP